MPKILLILLLFILNIKSSLLQIEPSNQLYHPLQVHQPYHQPYGQLGHIGHDGHMGHIGHDGHMGHIGHDGHMGHVGQVGQFGSLAFSVGHQCDIHIESDPEFQKCRTEAIVDWGSTTYTDRQIKYLCCYNWDIIDCMETAVQYRCSRNEFDFEDYYKNFAVRKEEMRGYLEAHQCVDYEYGSIKCHFFWWVIAIIVIVGFVIILIIAAICYRFMRKKRSNGIVTTDVKVHK